jgi:amino acid adenylation domain-containing protein
VDWIELSTLEPSLAQESTDNLGIANKAAVAYVMYTSGSTGAPKGVVVPHRAVNRLSINNGYAAIEPADCIAHCSNPAFDAATFEIWGALLNGARVLIVPHSTVLEPGMFAEALQTHGVTALFVTTALFNQHATAGGSFFPQLRHLLFGGEMCDAGIVRQVLRTRSPQKLIHVYGPTETTTFASSYPIESVPADAHNIPIGRPISNTQIYVLDAHRQPAPIGVAGEIYIGGAGVALGYLNRAELTAERFVADPFSEDAQARLYKTGDVGRWRADGNLEYLGRNDHQVKIRGHRIELGEIESQLSRHAQVKEAVVLAREATSSEVASGEKRLVAYVTCAVPGELQVEDLRRHLKAVLPEYMVPSAYVVLESLPLTANGKLDRKALPAPDLEAYGTKEYIAARNSIEASLCALWKDVLQLQKVGVNDNFFDLGGSSLNAVLVVQRMQRDLKLKVSVIQMFIYPTVSHMAQYLSNSETEKTQQREASWDSSRPEALQTRRDSMMRRRRAKSRGSPSTQ